MTDIEQRDQTRISDILSSVNGYIEEEEHKVADIPSLYFLTPDAHPSFWCKPILALMKELIRSTTVHLKDAIGNGTFDDTVTTEVLRSVSRVTSALTVYRILRAQENSCKKQDE